MNHRRIGSACLVTGALILAACSSDSDGGGPATGTGGAMGAATGGGTGVPGTGGATGMVGTGGATSVVGTGGATSALPTGGATSTVPTGGTTSTVPTGGATSTVPTGGTTSLVPTGGTTSLVPTGGTTSLVPTGGTTGMPTGGTTGVPTGGMTGTPTGGTTGAPTGGTTGTPTGGATGTTGGTTGTGGTTEPPEPLGGYHVHGDWAGFAFTFATQASIEPDSETGFTDMIDEDGPYCVSGTVKASADYTSIAAVGFNTNQEKIEDAEVHTTVSQSNGLMIHVTDPGLPSLRVQIEDGILDDPDTEEDEGAEHRWCANISDFGQDLVIPWTGFDKTCWDPDDDEDPGVAFDPATPIAKAIVYYPDEGPDGSDQNFDFCVNDIGPADVVSIGDGEIVASCGNSVSWSQGNLSGTSGTLSTDGKYGMQANGWDDGGGGIGITGNGGGGFHVDSTNCAKTSETDGPCSFPSVFRGVRWGDAGTSSDNLPIQVSALSSAPTCLGWSAGSGDGYNISFDVWFSSNAGATTPDKYLMLWFRTPTNWQPAGDFPEANIVIGDQTWARWYGPNTDGQQVTTYAARGVLAEGAAYSFDLKDFIGDAVAKGHISSSDYLISVMGGIEIWEGGQGASIDGFRTDPQ